MTAILIGVDLSSVWDKFALWLLQDKKDGVIQFAKREQTKKAIQGVIDLFNKKLKGQSVIRDDWKSVGAAAGDAAAGDAAAYAARKNHYKKMAKKLLQLLKKTK